MRGTGRRQRGRLRSFGKLGLLLAVPLASLAARTNAFAQDQGAIGAPAPAAGPPAPGIAVPLPAGPPAPGIAAPLPATAPGGPQGLPILAAPTPAAVGPPVGVSVRLGNVESAIAAASAVGGILAPPAGLSVVPSLGLSEEYNSNIFDTSTGQLSDVITNINPGILINLSTPSATGTLSYYPSVQFYAEHSSQNDVLQDLNGSLEAELLPRTLFLSVNAYASQQSTTGGVVPGGLNTTSSSNRTTTIGFSVQPSFVHQFGDTGTLQITYSLQYSNQNGSAATAPGATLPYFVPSHAVANYGSVSFTTGPSLGRFNDTVTATGGLESGTGVLNGAYQFLVDNTLRFAVVRRVYVFGTFGYEDLFYPSEPKILIQDGVWAVGFTLTPKPDTSITAGYGHFGGFNSPYLTATIALSPRTTFAATYSDTLGTSLQFLQSALANTLVNPAGTPVNSQTGAPVLLTNQLLSLQSGVSRNAIFSASLITTFPRDTVALSVVNQQSKLVANAPGTSGYSQRSWTGSIAWTHALTPRLSAAAYLDGGETNSLAVGSGLTPVAGGQLSLVYQFTPTLTGSALYGITNSWESSGNALQNIVILALQKTF